jgi:hypothetical protein
MFGAAFLLAMRRQGRRAVLFIGLGGVGGLSHSRVVVLWLGRRAGCSVFFRLIFANGAA